MNILNQSATAAEDFPLLALSPVANSRHSWAALMLAGLVPADRLWLEQMGRLFTEFGLQEALGGLACILPLTDPDSLDDDLAALLPREQIVLRIPLERCLDPASGASLERLRTLGFHLMADGLPAAGQVLHATISAVASDGPGLPAVLAHLPGPHLATAVDNSERLKQAHGAGYAWFAGDYPLHPALGKAQHGGSSSALLLKLLAMVASDADSREIEALLKQDPSLSYQLLKLVNSVSFSLSTKIANFGHAITLLGRRQLQRWLQLLIYAQPANEDPASPLMVRAARRASLMETLCQKVGGSKDDQEQAFMTGMFSLLDVLFGQPMEKIITPLNLGDEVDAALLRKSGWLGNLLSLVEASERAPTSSLAGQLEAVMLTPANYAQAVVHACGWAIQVSRQT